VNGGWRFAYAADVNLDSSALKDALLGLTVPPHGTEASSSLIQFEPQKSGGIGDSCELVTSLGNRQISSICVSVFRRQFDLLQIRQQSAPFAVSLRQSLRSLAMASL